MEAIKKVEAVRPQMIRVRDINTPIYQRPYDYGRAAWIADHYDNRLLGTLLVSHRGGKYYVIDGQHRLIALRKLGVVDAPCVIMTGLNERKEAELFRQFNTQRKALDRGDVLLAKLVSYDQDAMDMVSKITDAGFTCSTRPQGQRANRVNITAVAAIERAYKLLRGSQFGEMLTALGEVWPHDKDAVCASMLNGVSYFWSLYGDEFDDKVMRETLTDLEPKKIMLKAHATCDAANNRNLRIPIAKVLFKEYNARATKKLKAKII